MKYVFLLIVFITTPLLASEVLTSHVVDQAAGLDAVVITFPAEMNKGFAVIDVPLKRKKDNIGAHWDPSNHIFMINGGYFECDFSPTGFCKIDGKMIANTREKKLSGFVALDKAGSIFFLTRTDSLKEYPTVLQSGPYVIDPGGKIGIKSRSGKSTKRTLIGMTQEGAIVVVVTKPVYLFDLAHSIKKHIPSIERLLNMDGGPSTALKTTSHAIVNEWPVRNYIVKFASQKGER